MNRLCERPELITEKSFVSNIFYFFNGLRVLLEVRKSLCA